MICVRVSLMKRLDAAHSKWQRSKISAIYIFKLGVEWRG